MQFDTIKEACRAWVSELDRVPTSVIDKLYEYNDLDLQEVTPPTKYDHVIYYSEGYAGQHGEVIETNYDGDSEKYLVRLEDDPDHPVEAHRDDLTVVVEDQFPMWSTMWAFNDTADNDWLDGKFGEDGKQLMADCGFRIYESEDYGYVFGINGAGYDFYECHWIPLYKARGLKWHKEVA